MSFIIKELIVYSHNGDIRTVKFKTGFNVLTGASKTGKSAIIDIIEYCLGRQNCHVAEGVIRKKVSWFGLLLSKEGDQLFVARKNPGPSMNTSPEIYIKRGDHSVFPTLEELDKNITNDGLVELITKYAGISENENRPTYGTRRPLSASIRHALFLCFQNQDEIDSRERLFHRQGDDFIPQAIKDTLPYFLGAVDETYFLKQVELDLARKELQKIEAELTQKENAFEASKRRLTTLINELKKVGFLQHDFVHIEENTTIEKLRKIANFDISSDIIMPDFGETIFNLKHEIKALQMAVTEKGQDISAARGFLADQNSFTQEVNEQASRLKSIELYKTEDTDHKNCPLCENQLNIPSPSASNIVVSLGNLKKQMEAVHGESPHIQEHIELLESNKSDLISSLTESQKELNRIVEEDAKTQAHQDLLTQKAIAIGRVKAFLENIEGSSYEDDDFSRYEDAKTKVDNLEAALNKEDVAQKIDTFLNIISNKMSDYSKNLSLEHSGSSLRLDLKKLTVVADTEDGPIPLYKMGSGENWVGYHVLAYLALHWWLRKRDRPCPGFLIFDQPSQAHYPAESDRNGSLEPLKDEDRHAVHSLFQLMHDACLEIKPEFQLIVLDHAHLQENWFNSSIVEVWRENKALIPQDWPSST